MFCRRFRNGSRLGIVLAAVLSGQAKSVLLHEMIHYIIGYTGLKDTSAHGVVFKGLMDKLNSQYGWDMSQIDLRRS